MPPPRALRRHWVLWTYLLLLVASHLYRRIHPVDGRPGPDEGTQQLYEVAHDRELPGAIRIAYFERRPVGPDSARAPTLLLLHGSPGDHDEVQRLADHLPPRYRILAPDLPGFGGSTWHISDYSVRAHAQYVRQLLDSLGLRRVHVVGFSMGGGVGVNLANIASSRIASLTMLSAIGAQEYELLGDYHLNHAIHGLQLAALWSLQEAVPHFGALADFGLSVEYARNFYDTDQRPLRGFLSQLQSPMLIIQGDNDPLVPASLGYEHARLVPQSRLLLKHGDHFMTFQRPDELAADITGFIDDVENGTATTRATAAPARIVAAARRFDPRDIPPANGLAHGLLLLLLAAATLVSEDLTCIAAGLLVARGTVGFGPAAIACTFGIFVGDLLLYVVGRWLGRAVVTRAPLRWFVSSADLERSSQWFAHRGARLIFLTRFIPGTRLPTYVTAGVLKTNFASFVLYFLLAAVVWTPLLVGLSALFGGSAQMAFEHYHRWAFPALAITAVLLLLLLKVFIPLFTFRGRRLLLSRWRRLTRWEFWPPWVFYPPVVFYIVWLGIKHRSLTLFTAVNPAIPGGGFVGESKAQILAGLRVHSPTRLPPTLPLDSERPVSENLKGIREFMSARALDFPIVLKPDVGERGSGVAIVGSLDEADQYLRQSTGDILCQAYVSGPEFGVFYYRKPGNTSGAIFSITEKRLPTVTGDGKRTLEELILSDDRAVCMAKFLLAQHCHRLWDVPARGVEVPLVWVGTHCRGAAFYDGGWVRTAALEGAVDEISRGYDGFWFGRYDVRAPSVERLQAGEFTIIELNGATSEATNIYDPTTRLLDAYRILFAQWRILFEIAAHHREAGVKPSSIREIVALLLRHRRMIGTRRNA